MRLVVIGATLPLFVGSAAGAQVPERFALAGDQVALVNLAGEVRIERGTGSSVVLEINRQGSDADRLAVRTEDMNGWRALKIVYPEDRIVYPRLGRFSRSEFDIDSDGSPSRRILQASVEENGFAFPGSVRLRGSRRIRVSNSGSGLEAYADVRILVPAGRTVAVLLGVGRVDVSGVDAHVRVDARAGSVTAQRVNGSLLINTGSGGVDVTAARGHVRIDTGSGSVHADNVTGGSLMIDTGSGGVDAATLDVTALDIDTGSGSIRIDGARAPELHLETGSGGIRANAMTARDVELDTGSGSITLELLSDVRTARLDTGSGGVTLIVPPSLGADFIMDTGSGSINVDAPAQITQKRRSHMRGRIGDGQGSIVIDTGSGGINLRSSR
jgi:lia operon protein LiaG